MPPGAKVLIFLNPDLVATFGGHVIDGWYSRPSPEQYKCLKCYNPETGGTQDADIVEFFHTTIQIPNIMTKDYPRQAATDIISILRNKHTSVLPSLEYSLVINKSYVKVQ